MLYGLFQPQPYGAEIKIKIGGEEGRIPANSARHFQSYHVQPCEYPKGTLTSGTGYSLI